MAPPAAAPIVARSVPFPAVITDAREVDVLIVGAGPAGAATALQLARAGFRVLLTDKKAFPRDKPCGEFFSPQCVPYLQALGLGDLFARLGAWRVHGMRLSTSGRTSEGRFRRLPDRGAHGDTGFGLRRVVFDHELVRAAQRAGASFWPRHEFVALCRTDDGGVTGALLRDPAGELHTVAARYVVGADGVRSRVAKALGVQRPLRWLDQVAFVAHFRDVPPGDHSAVHLLRGGFCAATTVDDGIWSFNLVVPRATLRTRPPGDWDAFVHGALRDAPELVERLRRGTRLSPWRGTGPMAFTTTAQTRAGIALVGDAAGYVDPLTGEGLYYALFGARALGEALERALHRPAAAPQALAHYCRTRRRELAPRLFVARQIQRALRHPWLVSAVVGAFRRHPNLADLAVTLTGDTVHPRELWRPSFWRQFAAAAVPAHPAALEAAITDRVAPTRGC